VHDLAGQPEEFRVQVPAAQAVKPAGALGYPVRRITDQGVSPVFSAHRDGDHGDDADYDPTEEQSDCHNDYDTGHDGLPHFRPAEFLPQVPFSVVPAWRGAPAALVLADCGVPSVRDMYILSGTFC
jgi:hypothetical protein